MPIVEGSEREIDVSTDWDVEAMLALENQHAARLVDRPDDFEKQLAAYLNIKKITAEARVATKANLAILRMGHELGARGRFQGLHSYSTREVVDYIKNSGLLPADPAEVLSYVKAAQSAPSYLNSIFALHRPVQTQSIGVGPLNGEEPWQHFNWQKEGAEIVPRGTEFKTYLAWNRAFSDGKPVWAFVNEGRPHKMIGADCKELRPTGPPHIVPGGHFTQFDTFFVRVPDEEVVPNEEEQAN